MASTANCSPCHRGSSLQTTSLRRASCTGTSKLMSTSRTFLATRARPRGTPWRVLAQEGWRARQKRTVCDSSSARAAGERFEKPFRTCAQGQHDAAIHGGGHMVHHSTGPHGSEGWTLETTKSTRATDFGAAGSAVSSRQRKPPRALPVPTPSGFHTKV